MAIELPEVDRIQESDRSNYVASKAELFKICPSAIAAVQSCVAYLAALADGFGARSNYHALNAIVADWLEQLPPPHEDHIRRLEAAAAQNDSTDLKDAREAYHRAYSALARSSLLLRLRRDFVFGIGDLLKLRVTPPLGLLRLQCESTALMHLMAERPSIATRWMKTLQQQEGRQFYNDFHSQIVAKLRNLILYEHYEQGSGIALHSRVGGVAPGVLAAQALAEPGAVALAYQEVTNARDLLFWLALFLKVHAEILGTLQPSLPELEFPETERSSFDESFATTWAEVGRLHLARTAQK